MLLRTWVVCGSLSLLLLMSGGCTSGADVEVEDEGDSTVAQADGDDSGDSTGQVGPPPTSDPSPGGSAEGAAEEHSGDEADVGEMEEGAGEPGQEPAATEEPSEAPAPADDGDSEPADVPEDAGDDSPAPSDVDSQVALGPRAADGTANLPVPAEDDTLKLSYPNDPNTLNLIIANDTVSTAFQRWVYEPLADRDFHDPDQFVPVLAEKWEFDPDTLTYTIHLRRGVKWHPMTLPDGTPLPEREVTAEDVKFTFDCVLNPSVQAASLRSYYEDPEATTAEERYKIEVQVIDDYTFTVRWKKPYFLADEFTLLFPPLPMHVYGVDEFGDPISTDYSSAEFATAFNEHWANGRMCGTGPMMFEQWSREQELTLVRNPDYWGQPFYFSRVQFKCEPNSNTALNMALNNELDWSPVAEKDLYVQSADAPAVVSGKVLRQAYDFPGYRYIGYNLRRPFLADKLVRQALAHCVPVDEIVERVFHNLAIPSRGPFLPGSSAEDPSVQRITYDLERARQLLDEAGWTDADGNGVREKEVDGQTVEARLDLMIYADTQQYASVAEIIQQNLRDVGVEMTISPNKWALMLDRLRAKDFDAAMLGWALNWKSDPHQIFHGSQADLPDSSNAGGYSNPEVDRLIEELRVTMDPAQQTEIFHEIHRLIYDDQPYTFLFVDKATSLQDARIENVRFYKIRPCYDVREWSASFAR